MEECKYDFIAKYPSLEIYITKKTARDKLELCAPFNLKFKPIKNPKTWGKPTISFDNKMTMFFLGRMSNIYHTFLRVQKARDLYHKRLIKHGANKQERKYIMMWNFHIYVHSRPPKEALKFLRKNGSLFTSCRPTESEKIKWEKHWEKYNDGQF